MLTHSWQVSRITTPGATATTAATADPAAVRAEGIAGDYQGHVDARIFGRSATGSAYLVKRANIRRVGGTLARVGTALDLLAPVLDVALSTATADIVVSGTQILVRVTGVAATSVTWDIDVETRIYHG
jgi:hypothetical protein